VVGGAGQQVQRADRAKVDGAAADLEVAADQRVVAEQSLDDPQVERPREVLGVLEPVLEGAVPREVLLVADVVEQLHVLLDLALRLERDEPAEHELALEAPTQSSEYTDA
jgi:hypothetical protein